MFCFLSQRALLPIPEGFSMLCLECVEFHVFIPAWEAQALFTWEWHLKMRVFQLYGVNKQKKCSGEFAVVSMPGRVVRYKIMNSAVSLYYCILTQLYVQSEGVVKWGVGCVWWIMLIWQPWCWTQLSNAGLSSQLCPNWWIQEHSFRMRMLLVFSQAEKGWLAQKHSCHLLYCSCRKSLNCIHL